MPCNRVLYQKTSNRVNCVLGIVGNDGYELLEVFCEEFGIQNMSEIAPYKYFDPKGCSTFVLLVWFYCLMFDREKLRDSDTTLTLRDLVKLAEAKRWIPLETK